MSNIEKFDPAKLMDGVRDRIKATFVSLIPDDKWEELVKAEVDSFFSKKETNNYNNNREYKSDFDYLVSKYLREEAQRRLVEYMLSDTFNTIWDGYGNPIISEAVNKLIIDNAGVMLANMFGGMINSSLTQITYNLKNQQY